MPLGTDGVLSRRPTKCAGLGTGVLCCIRDFRLGLRNKTSKQYDRLLTYVVGADILIIEKISWRPSSEKDLWPDCRPTIQSWSSEQVLQ